MESGETLLYVVEATPSELKVNPHEAEAAGEAATGRQSWWRSRPRDAWTNFPY